LFAQVTDYGLSDAVSIKSLWAASWPILIGALLALLVKRLDASIPRIPEGDVIVLLERLVPIVARLGNAMERTDLFLRRWPIGSLLLLTLAIVLSATLQFAR
jgi:hypothetical protein